MCFVLLGNLPFTFFIAKTKRSRFRSAPLVLLLTQLQPRRLELPRCSSTGQREVHCWPTGMRSYTQTYASSGRYRSWCPYQVQVPQPSHRRSHTVPEDLIPQDTSYPSQGGPYDCS